jgi:hypothetical protein
MRGGDLLLPLLFSFQSRHQSSCPRHRAALSSQARLIMKPLMSRFVRVLFALGCLTLAAFAYSYASIPENKDFISYWATAHILARHQNPYDAKNVYALQQTGDPAHPLIMRNPPPDLLLVVPLEHLSPRNGLMLWTILLFSCVMGYFKLMKVPANSRLLAYGFAPFLACMYTGQSSPFLLLGLAIFLSCYEDRPFLAGSGLFLLTIKPHLFIAFWPVLLLECLYRRRGKVLTGFAITLCVASAVATLLWPHSWVQYFAMAHSANLQNEFLQTPACALRKLFFLNHAWVQLLPAVIAAVWGATRYIRRRQSWDWKVDGALLMLVSVLASPYGWLTDEIVLLPALLFAAENPKKRKYAVPVFLALNLIADVLLFRGHPLSSGVYLWTSTAWFLWFVWSQSSLVEKTTEQATQPVLTPQTPFPTSNPSNS